ncbi:unnamed protein product [Phyllotreta striolata]|uniref:FHA domain-containing protein n=1 Tax=Phyllotreta striolata TaxID=444603 RepID=A0A9N9TX23_PHYSR|nr:unnamed protein product [Phyllotreta striolata]
MVVVSGNWVKNVATYPPSNVISDVVITADRMEPKAILTCRPNSHHFQDRTLVLDQPAKVGRSVARLKPTPNNAIFDCKVLSRHHALLWYENGIFYLQDTKSSNGTFVNNSRLNPENSIHELSSGDIVQFGVDVVENNKKVTHGCIIATIKLYLPDGKEAKASPINEGGMPGMVPLDDLYRLNQILQEANQREQCLESKLSALQHVVDETRKSAEESWQAYVGEERLLSRVSALETQLQQANKNAGDDRLRESLARLQAEKETYQVAAKEALDKLHAERLEAVTMAMEQERARISAEHDAMLAKEQWSQAQADLEELARKYSEQRTESHEQRTKLEQIIQELEAKLEAQESFFIDREIYPCFDAKIQNNESIADKQSDLIYNADVKSEKGVICDNDEKESLLNQSNGLGSHINLTVGPVEEKYESEKALEPNADEQNSNDLRNESQDEPKRVKFEMPDETESYDGNKSCTDGSIEVEIDSKTLKYQFHVAQSELKSKIETLESIASAHRNKIEELDRALQTEQTVSKNYLQENEVLQQELALLRQKWKECCNENQQQKNKLIGVNQELEIALGNLKQSNERLEKFEETSEKSSASPAEPNLLKCVVTFEQLAQLEEELVLIKERFAQVSEDKLRLKRDLASMQGQYEVVCNRFYNKFFWYVMPLIGMVLYLLISAMVS